MDRQMPKSPPTSRTHLTLLLATVLHTFTHAYGTLLVPLYLMIRDDLHLRGVKSAALIVTVYGVTYALLSFGAGVLADRHDRRLLLGVGLVGNAIAILLMGLTHTYWVLLALAVMAGVFGTLFHPSANALIPAHYPKAPGMAIGLLGVGSGLGFYVGPKFSGWRAEAARWNWGQVAQWQKPLVELGLLGLVFGVIFLLLATEAVRRNGAGPPEEHPPLGRALRRRVLAIAATLGCRDFAGVSSVSLIGIYLQKAHGMTVQQTGAMVGSMMLISIFVNPVMVYVSPRRRRLPMMVALLLTGGAALATVPFVPLRWTWPALAVFQALHLGSYAVSDAAILERVGAELRGRVVGLFLVIAGTAGACGPWVMGWRTDALGSRAADAASYAWIFGATGAFMAFAVTSAPIIAGLGIVREEIGALSEVMPGTVETVG
jgi:MFS family permease